jgi:hypothetical protein
MLQYIYNIKILFFVVRIVEGLNVLSPIMFAMCFCNMLLQLGTWVFLGEVIMLQNLVL